MGFLRRLFGIFSDPFVMFVSETKDGVERWGEVEAIKPGEKEMGLGFYTTYDIKWDDGEIEKSVPTYHFQWDGLMYVRKK